jgi:hypothetical protein
MGVDITVATTLHLQSGTWRVTKPARAVCNTTRPGGINFDSLILLFCTRFNLHPRSLSSAFSLARGHAWSMRQKPY